MFIKGQRTGQTHIVSTNGAYVYGPDDALVSADPLTSWLALGLFAFDRPPGVRLNLYRDDEWLIDAPAPSLLALHEHTGFAHHRSGSYLRSAIADDTPAHDDDASHTDRGR